MQYTVKNDTPFQILTSAIVIGPSQTGYQLEVAADGKNFSPLFTVGANVTRQATNLSSGAYYRLSGNVGDVIVNWVRSCVTPGGSGGAGNELTPVTEFPVGAEAGTVVALASGDTYGIYQYDGTDWNPAGGEADLSAYWTSAETQSAITEVEDHLLEVEQVTASALTELHDDILELSGSSVDLSAYYTSAQTEEAISAATSGKADAVNAEANPNRMQFPTWNEQGVITSTNSLSTVYQRHITVNDNRETFITPSSVASIEFYAPTTPGTAGQVLVSVGNGAPVWSAMPAADVTKAYVDSADRALQNQIDTMDEVVSASLVDLEGKKVESQDVKHIVKLTQAQYDQLATKDPYTFYIIVSN